jgi:hypothetical protein
MTFRASSKLWNWLEVMEWSNTAASPHSQLDTFRNPVIYVTAMYFFARLFVSRTVYRYWT